MALSGKRDFPRHLDMSRSYRAKWAALSVALVWSGSPAVRAQPEAPDAASAEPAAPPPAEAPALSAPTEEPPVALPGDVVSPSGVGAPPAPMDAGSDSGVPPALRVDDSDMQTIPVQESSEGGAITIEEIVNPTVVSASRREESARDAPANVITITAREIEERGYTELTDFLDDLPGMDVVRPFGDVYLKVYWRGFRSDVGTGSPFLFMIDGVVWNHLYFNDKEIMASVPLSNIEQIEVVYGPASVLYGPNAAMGIINVITKQPEGEADDGEEPKRLNVLSTLSLRTPTSRVRLDDTTKIADAHILFRQGDFSVSASGHFDVGVLEPAIGERWEYTRNRYYADRNLWGDFVDEQAIAGEFRSEHDKRGLDLRLRYKGTELAAQYYRLQSGEGTVYPADFVQTKVPFVHQERGVLLRHTQQLSPHVASVSMVRYRESDVPNPSSFLERNPDGTVSLSYWQAINSSLLAVEDLVIDAGKLRILPGDSLQLNFGIRYEHRDLQQNYTLTGRDDPWPADVSFDEGYEFPAPPPDSRIDLENRTRVDLLGLYGLGKYRFLKDHSVDIGVRVDYSELLDELEATFRGGYVGRFVDAVTLKLLFGQAFQEPTTRAVLRNPAIRSERSQSIEAGADFVLDNMAFLASAYLVDYSDAIVAVGGIFDNIPARQMSGLDVGVRAALPVLRSLKLWAYYSTYFFAQETDFSIDDEGEVTFSEELTDVGDLAYHKVQAGITAEFSKQFVATLLGRCISSRTPFALNPLGDIPGYCTLDANLLFWLPDQFDGMGFALRVTNILDADYFHPGILDADAGNTPGFFEPETGDWVGSGGLYNARLPQPGRAVTLTLRGDF